jgi:bifunctional DNase/RNase
MDPIQLEVVGLTYSQTQSGAYALVLKEVNGHRRLPIIIGTFEAQSIAIALEQDTAPPRPMTHDLFKSFADSFFNTINEVVINRLQDGVFYALIKASGNGQKVELDARTSDAVAMALRFKVPIYTYEEILKSAGIILEESVDSPSEELNEPVEEDAKSSSDDLKSLRTDQLESLLSDAVGNEDYERAAAIRDELDRRSQN